ncbi:rRNA maturation RNase YbeY [Lacipirellula parvula]|uniref:Endoribonuclease YbeY n=1 Tax=Lacipirellula parvula TaxID=2650471 RepID=A0A5K7X7C3_9BACT|nr:rRNA maturation RNase YbeY [Lacipirellula parvula]BBO31737.1 metal-dependent hydrolase [Lacipirellula parvula]
MNSSRPSEQTNDDQEPPERRHRISIANETEVAVDAERIERAVCWALDDTPYDEATVSIAIVDDETIHQLNRQFLAHDYPTDVLSFTLEDDPQQLEGEIIVSVDTARQNGAEAGWSADAELLLYVIHGTLHLAGYLDKDPEDYAEMRAAEAAVLDRLGVERSPTDVRWLAGNDDLAEEPTS